MTHEHLNQAIQECENGQLEFNLGNTRAFLLFKKWFPLRATVNRAAFFARENSNLTTDRALVELVFLGIWTRIQEINFQNSFPVDINENEIKEETKKLSKILYNLAN